MTSPEAIREPSARMGGQEIRNWLIRWFNPHPDHLGKTDADLRRFYELVCRPDEPILQDELPLADGTDFSQNLFYRQLATPTLARSCSTN